jgi:hypothetical protein
MFHFKTVLTMKKLLMLVVAAMFATVNVNAQSAGEMYIKPMAGGTLTTMVGDVDNAKMKFGFVGGAEFVYNISYQFGISAGALYTMQGAKNDKVDKNMNLDYLNIPVLANVYVAPGLAIKAGPQLGILMNAKIDGVNMKDFCNTIDFSIPVGLSYEISDFIIDARYNIGITKINKDVTSSGWESDGSARNSVIMLTVGYKIPL